MRIHTDISFHAVLEKQRQLLHEATFCPGSKVWGEVYEGVVTARDETRLHLLTALQGTDEFDYVIPGMGKP